MYLDAAALDDGRRVARLDAEDAALLTRRSPVRSRGTPDAATVAAERGARRQYRQARRAIERAAVAYGAAPDAASSEARPTPSRIRKAAMRRVSKSLRKRHRASKAPADTDP